ncbi:AAA family ATPase [Prevotella sp. KH2C16]|uniref:RAD55 family ATPase n=1 Tax=Prevotella sp. KH2C16 TaxID=1855325 RepID=UPI0008F32DD1|nr:AAA family ATPase [Prevotella sp. KH2C16]SFG12888.1 AAA domain-containing protein [Prevotella sp. KH2C16]
MKTDDRSILPFAERVEKELTCAVLSSSEAVDRVFACGVTAEMLYNKACRGVFRVIGLLNASRGGHATLFDVQQYLSVHPTPDLDFNRLVDILGFLPSAPLETLCRYVVDAYAHRQGAVLSQRAVEAFADPSEDVSATIANIRAWTDGLARIADPSARATGTDYSRFEFDTSEDVAMPDYLYTIGGVGTIPEGSIVAVTGKAKAGKTNFLMLLLSSMIAPGTFSSIRPTRRLDNIMYIDTEQPRHAIMLKFRRMLATAGLDIRTPLRNTGLHLYSMRDATIQERRGILGYAAETVRPQLVIIDGIVDMVDDFNDIADSASLIAELMRMSAAGITVVALLHENEGNGKMRGHLGTFLLQKCDDIFQVAKGNRCFTVKHVGRNSEIADFSFAIENGGAMGRYTVHGREEERAEAAEREHDAAAFIRGVFADNKTGNMPRATVIYLLNQHYGWTGRSKADACIRHFTGNLIRYDPGTGDLLLSEPP